MVPNLSACQWTPLSYRQLCHHLDLCPTEVT